MVIPNHVLGSQTVAGPQPIRTGQIPLKGSNFDRFSAASKTVTVASDFMSSGKRFLSESTCYLRYWMEANLDLQKSSSSKAYVLLTICRFACVLVTAYVPSKTCTPTVGLQLLVASASGIHRSSQLFSSSMPFARQTAGAPT